MMGKLKLALALCVPVMMGGCAVVATTSPDWDAQFGDSVRVLQAQQLLDAQAPTRNAQNMPAADGRTVREATDRHVENYRSPPTPSVINIGVGGGGG